MLLTLLPQQRAAPAADAVADRVRLPQQRHGGDRGHPATRRGASIRTSPTNCSCAGRRRKSRRWSTSCSRTCATTACSRRSRIAREWRRPPAESSEAVQLSVLAQDHRARSSSATTWRSRCCCSAGSGSSPRKRSRTQCQLMAQRMAMLYELQFARVLRSRAVRQLHRAAAQPRGRRLAADGRSATYTDRARAP